MYRKILSKGIEPIIATIIIVAVTLVIAIAVIGWIMGWWGALTGGQESLYIYADSKIIADTNNKNINMSLHIANRGGASASIYKIEVANCIIEGGDINPSLIKYKTMSGSINVDTTNNLIVLSPGFEGYVYIPKGTCSLVPGTTYSVKIYTRAGNQYPANLVVEAGTVSI